MEIKRYEWGRLDAEARRALCRRAESRISREVLAAVRRILAAVQREGDAALRRYTRRYDGAALRGRPLAVSEAELEQAEGLLPPELREAIGFAVHSVQQVHQAQSREALILQESRSGVYVGERFTPLDSVGLYVPRGRGSFPSVMYMQAVPARVAGVRRVVAVSPPDPQGQVDPAVLYAARLCGVREIYRVGGAQAIAALAYGTQSVPRVDKILGPGSVYVAAARRELQGTVDVGFPAGPSESVVLADEEADPQRAALDLMVEAEHGSDSSAFLVTPSAALADAAAAALPGLVAELEPQRGAYVRDVLAGYGGIVLTRDLAEAVEFVNAFAPEHLQIACRDPLAVLPQIANAGEILLGQRATFSLANYAAGCNNVIPTGGWARTRSPLSVRDFQKSSSLLYVTAAGLEDLRAPVSALARYEGFPAHARAVAPEGAAPQGPRPGTAAAPEGAP